DTPSISPSDSPYRSPSFGPRTIPLELVAGLLFHLPVDLQRRDQLMNRLKSTPARGDDQEDRARQSDRLILENGDEIFGQISEINDKSVELKADVGPISVERTKIAAVAFNPSLLARLPTSGPRVLVGLRDGSRVTVSNLTYDGNQVRLTLPDGSGGLTWTTA